jgi:hypothetical protein
MRVQMNYVRADVSGLGAVDIVQARFQIDF